jgi:acid phosphatase (class A)
MAEWLNKVTYGNLNQTLLENMQKMCIADEVIPLLDGELKDKIQPPKNSSEKTKDELTSMVEKVSNITDESNAEHFRRFKRYDRSLVQTITSTFMQKGLDVEEICLSVNGDIAPTIIKLKQKYQRPRPYQLAEYYKLKMFPYETYSGHSPSYPSGHTIQAYCMLSVVGNKYPNSYDFCKKMIDDIAYSRVHLGLHYPSDNDASFIIGQEIIKLKSFSEKYKI